MGWFRRSRPAPPSDETTELVHVSADESVALARTERALQMLATQSAQLHTSIVHLEHRVDVMSASLVDRCDVPSHEDVIRARLQTAKVAAEVSRLEINLASRIDAVRHEVRGADGAVDLRTGTPLDTGF